jgi:hypothetical protein
MRRDGFHYSFLVSITLIWILLSAVVLVTADMKYFLVTCGWYAIFLASYSLFCWFATPKNLRQRPAKPDSFRAIQIGRSIGRDVEASLATVLLNEKVAGITRYSHHRTEVNHFQGIWFCEWECRNGIVVAVVKGFESVASQVLDKKTQVGGGIFIVSFD